MDNKWQTFPLRCWRAGGRCALLALVGAALVLARAPAARAVDIVNRATAELTVPSLAQPVLLTSESVTTRVETPTGVPFQITQQVSPTTALPGQEVVFTLSATRRSNSVAAPFAVNVNGLSQSLLLLKVMIPANTTFVRAAARTAAMRVATPAAGQILYHRVGDAEHDYYTTVPNELLRVDKVAWGFPSLSVGTNVTVTFVVKINANADGPVRNTAMVVYAENTNGPPKTLPSNPVQFDVAGTPSAIRSFRDGGFSTPINSTVLSQPIFLQADSAPCNAIPDVIETNVVVITSAKTGDRESMMVVETGPNTGVFRVLRGLPTRDVGQFPVGVENGFIETTRDDTLTVEFLGCGTRRVETLILVDPSGVVFDSLSNTPVAGARVTLQDAASGSPAAVFGPDGVTPAPNSIVTAGDGRYVFPTVRPGIYRLQVTPPPGYQGPSTLAASKLPAGHAIHAPGSFGGSFTVSALTGPVTIDYPLDPLAIGGVGMFLQKTGSRATAEIGDFIDYTVRVRNVSGLALFGVRILDSLPAGFAYQTGTAKFEGAAIQPATTGGGPRLDFAVGLIDRDATVTLTYRVRIGPGALQGNGINSAAATSAGAPVFTSNVASHRVQLQGGVFTDKAFIIGKVFVDANGNHIQDAGEPGIPGVRIFLEDGTYAVTDGAGKYSFYGLSPRTHVVKLDDTTLPAGAKMLALSTRNAGVGTSRFADLKRGELHKADFAEGSATPAILAEVQARRKKAGALNGEIEAQLKSELTRDGAPVPAGDLRAQPASGLIGSARAVPAAPAADPGAGAGAGARRVITNTIPIVISDPLLPSAAAPAGPAAPVAAEVETPAARSIPITAAMVTSDQQPSAAPARRTIPLTLPKLTRDAQPSSAAVAAAGAVETAAPRTIPITAAMVTSDQQPSTAPGLRWIPLTLPKLTSDSRLSSAAAPRADSKAPAPRTISPTAATVTSDQQPSIASGSRRIPIGLPTVTSDAPPSSGAPPPPDSEAPALRTIPLTAPTVTSDVLLSASPARRTIPVTIPTLTSDSLPPAAIAEPTTASRAPPATSVGLTTNDTFTTLLPANLLTGDTTGLPPAPAGPAPLLNLSVALTNLDNSLGFVDFKDRDTLPMPQATVRVKGTQGAKFSLTVNGTEVPVARVGKRTEIADLKLQVWDYIGVSFKPGENALELVQKDPFGNVRGTRRIALIAPDRLGIIRILLPKELPAADGRTPVTVRVELVDAKGVPVTARTALTLESTLGRWEVEDLDKKEPGIQVFLEGGRGEYPLVPPMEPGDAQLTISSGVLKGEAKLSFLPELRPLIAVGIIEGQINVNRLDFRALMPTRSRDGFDEELRGFALSSRDGKVNGGGRTAFFLKGKIKGDMLLTASYDSDKLTRERLFRDIQPDEFYPVYGDSSVRGFDAQTTGKFFVRVDKKKCYALYGDYVTQSNNEARSLGNYNRSLTGLRTHLEQGWLNANAWVAHDSTRQIIEELPANGTSGPYLFHISDGLVNSEKVEILTRDRQQPAVILKTVALARFSDYEFEPFTGRILFKAPVPSLDANLNPISIRVTYEADQGGDKFWVFGADAQVKLHERVEVGVSMARDQNPVAPYQLYGANATVKLAPKTFLLAEVAQSDAAGVTGNAGRIEVRHQDDKNEVRAYVGRADNTFSNSAAILSAGRVESGIKAVRKLGPSTRLLAQAIDTASAGGGSRRGVLVGVEHTFTNQVRVEVGARYSTETAATAGPVTAFPGLSQDEVMSLRAKVTAPIPFVKNGFVYSEYENDVQRTERRMAAVGADFQVTSRTKVYARHEFLSSVGSPFDLNSVQQQNITVFGVDSAYLKDGKFFNEYRMRNALTGREAETATGLRNGWSIADGLRINTTLERVSPLVRGGQSEATAGTAALEYTRSTDWKASTRLELRTSRQNDSLLHTFAYAQRLNDDWTFLGRTILHMLQNSGATGGEKFQGRIQAGFAWRQSETNVWNALLKAEYKREDDSTQPAQQLARDVAIVSVHAHYQPAANWFASAHYAGKAVWENSLGRNSTYLAHLLAGRASYEITKRWDLGLNASALLSGNLKSVQFGFGPELGYVLKDNFRFGVGYNVFGFRDRDLGAEDYTSHGAYLALRMKFDESLLHRLKPDAKKPD